MASSPLNPIDLPNFEGQSPAVPAADLASNPTPQRSQPVSFAIAAGRTAGAGESRVHPFPITRQPNQSPLLPRTKRPTFSRHRHDANPVLALKVLQDIQAAVEGWHHDLKQTVRQIQDIYLEGPIVDGWLEAIETPGNQMPPLQDAAILRHADPQDLNHYIEQLYNGQSPPPGGLPSPSLSGGGATRYRLCTLDADGRMKCLICPDDQLTTISLAVARNQKLRQLLNQKNYLEARLKRAVEVLSQARDDLDIAATTVAEVEPPPSSLQ